ncbi:DapH/DapD/GlmU-related protein [Beduinella massiliensis]|uniref:DapH/DapD/GlmU-related protein n=1 Tax=Beduinella massiliensis TaxID=1852363 RepID=UPI000C8634E4
MFKRIIRKIEFLYYSRFDRIKLARKLGVKIGENCRLISFPQFGSEPYLIEIGDHVTVSSDVSFVNHDGGTWVFREHDPYKNVIKFGRIRIGNNCFIGMRSTIMPGVSIGDDCVVGACSLVTKSIPPGEVWGRGYQLISSVQQKSMLINV